MPDIFISYSRRDKAFVERLSAALTARGKDAWVDWEDIPASAEWLREIQDGIDSTDAFLLVLSPDSVRSEVCAQELDHAIERRKRILPILHREVDPKTVRPEAAAINWVYLRDQDSFDAGIETLVTALDTDLEYVKAHTRLANQAINWERADHDRARLLRGSELEAAERWLTQSAAMQPAATELQAKFVQASRDAARRRGRIVFGAVTLALVVSVALAIVALIQRANAIHQSHVAFARQLDAQSQSQYPTDPELSVLLAVQAAHTAPGLETTEGLRNALGVSHIRERYTNPAGPVGDALWNPDGRRLMIADEDGGDARIVEPGADARAIVLPAPGITTQIGWDGSGNLAVTGGRQVTVWGSDGKLVRRLPTIGLQVALSQAGDRVATVDYPSGAIHVWDVASGRRLATGLPSAPGTAACLHLSPDGSTVAECLLFKDGRGALVLYDARSGRRLATVPQPGVFDNVAFSPDSTRIALAGGYGLNHPGTFILDSRTGVLLHAFNGPGTAVGWSPSGKQLAYGTIVGDIAWVYTLATGSQVPLVGNRGTIQSVTFSPDGAYVITGSSDRTARVFEELGGYEDEVLAGHSGPVIDASMNADSTELATASVDGTARVWTTPVPRAELSARLPQGVPRSVSFQPGGARAAIVGPGARGELLDGHTLHPIASFSAPAGQLYRGGGWSGDGRWLATLSGAAGTQPNTVQAGGLEVYDGRSATLTATIAPRSPIEDGAFNNRSQLATLSADGEVDLWSVVDGRLIRRLLAPGQPIEEVDFSHDGSKLAVTSADGTIALLSPSGARLELLHGPRPQPQFSALPNSALPVLATFSQDGRWLATIANNSVDLWDAGSGRLVRQLTPGGSFFASVAFSPNGTLLAAGNSASAFVWQVPSGNKLYELQHANPSVFGVVLPPFEGVQVKFSADGQTLATSGDIVVRAWNLQNGESLLAAPGSVGDMEADPPRVLTGSGGTARVYVCDLCGGLQQLLATAAHEVTRGLTAGERAEYLRQG